MDIDSFNEHINKYNESCDFDTSSDWAKALMATDKMSERDKKTLGCQLSRNSDYTGIMGYLNIEGLDMESMSLEDREKPENQAKIIKVREDMKNSLQNTDVSKISFMGTSLFISVFCMSASKENLISILNSPFVAGVEFSYLLSYD